MLLSVFYCVQLLLLLPMSSQSVLEYECSALLEFSKSFQIGDPGDINFFYAPCDGIPYPKTLHWEENYINGTSCCEWDGITCESSSTSSKSSHVIGVDLSCSGLQGNLHYNSSLFYLSHLQTLNLAFNDFNWSQIPSKIGQLSTLTNLNLSYCVLSGPVPSEISLLSKLKSLGLSDSYGGMSMEGVTWRRIVENLTDLSELRLSRVDFSTVPLPSVFENLTSSLITLDLSYCGLTGNNLRIPHLPKLEKLDLSRNYDLNASLGNVMHNLITSNTTLEILDLSLCRLQGEMPISLGILSKLSRMDLSDNNFNGSIPASFSNLAKLLYLDLSRNNLSGIIPTWPFSNFSNLEHLSLSGNNLIGSLPTQVRKLYNHTLSEMQLSHNHFTGPIPAWCFTLVSMWSLDLSSNHFNHIDEFSSATPSLAYLDLSFNNLSSSIPNLIFDLVNLEHLDLSSNSLQGYIPSSIFQVHNLTWLDLSSNNLSGFFDLNVLSNLKNLRYASISNNSLLSFSASSTSIEVNINNALPQLERLDFSNCNISDFPIFLKQASNLSYLNLSNNNIHGAVPKWFQVVGKDSLSSLLLSSNYLTKIELYQWRNLNFIDLRFNCFEGEIPIPPSFTMFFLASNNLFTGGISHSICNLSYLEVLNLSHNNLSGTIPQCLGNFSEFLSILDLQKNNFRGTLPDTFTTSACNLVTLKLGNNKLEGWVPRSLDSCTYLEILDLVHNKIKYTFPNWLEGLPNLQVLVLRDSQFYGFIKSPKTENPFPLLRILDVSNNNFSGPFPAAYITRFKAMMDITVSEHGEQYMMPSVVYDSRGASHHQFYEMPSSSYEDSIEVTIKGSEFVLEKILKIFTTLDLSYNKFEGGIPEAIGCLHSIKGLNLSHNVLNGSIPESFANLSSLECLDLSSNKLIGKIPISMNALSSLEVFNVSYNHLTGSIPEGTQFSTFPESSYIGNDGLCGMPLPRECNEHGEEPSSPSTSNRNQIEESNDDMEFGWKPVLLGYGSGFVFAGIIAYFVLSTRKPWWLVKLLLKSNKLKRLYLMMQ